MSVIGNVSKACHRAQIIPRILSSVGKARSYPTAAAPLSEAPRKEWKPNVRKEAEPAKVTRLDNGFTIASIENYAPLTHIGLFVNAGSGYENFDTIGASHYMKNCALLSNNDYSALRITRQTEQLGCNLKATNTREHFIISTECQRDRLSPVVDIIASTVKEPLFYRWEVGDKAEQVLLDIDAKDSDERACIMEALHLQAFRGPLSNPTYCPRFRVKSMSADTLHRFTKDHFTAPGMTLVGIGADHDELVTMATKSFRNISTAKGKAGEKSVYTGGAARWWTDSQLVNAAIVSEGASLESPDILAVGILAKILDSSPMIKYGSNTQTSRLSKSVSDVTSSPFAVSSLYESYAETGVIGSYVIANGNDIDKVLRAIIGQFDSMVKGGITNEELNKAKNKFKAAVSMSYENVSVVLKDLAVQAAYTGNYKSPSDIIQEVDKISQKDVTTAAKRVFSKPLTIVASGNVGKVPAIQALTN